MMRRENRSLWQVRHLWTSLCGDHVWVPCERMLGENDAELYTEDQVAKHLLSLANGPTAASDSHPSPAGVNGADPNETTNANKADEQEEADVEMGGTDPAQNPDQTAEGGKNTEAQDSGAASNPPADGAAKEVTGSELPNGVEASTKPGEHLATEHPDTAQAAPGEEAARDPHPSSHLAPPSVASEGFDQQFVHPMFLPPDQSRPDRDVGLPEQEAEDIRRLLALYIQKQEEVCRGVTRLHDGLNRAQRLRTDVLRWSKAEAHSGVNRDMSDGEDWYDKEEWGLADDLKKGQDDEEEDTTTTGKKTRARR